MSPAPALSLFTAFGLEIEYMIVDRDSLDVRPLVDRLFRDFSGRQVSDVDNGAIAWSNELAAHVLELKTNGPTADLQRAAADFHRNVELINGLLDRHGAMLLPGGAHPWMDPVREMVLWPHDAHEIYDLYNTIFDCRGHGWANLQSAHLNLPFAGDDEFARLHTAIRLLLPLMPALTASSPLLDGEPTGWLDSRLDVYLHNQDRLPALTGRLIPEPVTSEAEYEERIFAPIMAAIAPFDPEGIMDRYFLNARGAIARFDRGAIEIRILDTQECPLADCSIVRLIIECLRSLTAREWSDPGDQGVVDTEELRELFLRVIRQGGEAMVEDRDYLRLFGFEERAMPVRAIWAGLFDRCAGRIDGGSRAALALILERGCLASRILRALAGDTGRERLREVYRRLARSLATNTMFLP
jgi:gamma-glutamyl:cysteine ligase YbdK (ATP-grasp superfamily)